METNYITEFLTELKQNNNREWMNAHKELYHTAMEQFEQLVQNLIGDLSPSDSSVSQLNAKDLIFRLTRDTRFSHDKSPYNPSFRAHISAAGRAPVPVGYFLMISPGQSFIGGGLYASMFKDATKMLRDYLVLHGEEFLELIHAPEFRDNFILVGEQLKNVPRDYDASLPVSEYLKYKCLAVESPVSDEVLSDLGKLRDLALDRFILMQPFNAYVNRALEGFKMPER